MICRSGGFVLLCWYFVKLFVLIKRKPSLVVRVIVAPLNTEVLMVVPSQHQAVRGRLLCLSLPLSPGQMKSASGR